MSTPAAAVVLQDLLLLCCCCGPKPIRGVCVHTCGFCCCGSLVSLLPLACWGPVAARVVGHVFRDVARCAYGICAAAMRAWVSVSLHSLLLHTLRRPQHVWCV